MQPLSGIRVVSLEQAVAAPLCSRRLALAGAEVIKIERPEGDFARYYDTAVAGQSVYFVWLNAGKRSVVLDLGQEGDVRQLIGLIGTSDIVIQNLKPGALAARGVHFENLRRTHPRLITVSIAGFHPHGPSASRKAYDLLMQAESGLAAVTGTASAPGRVGVSLVDLATGHCAYEAILESLIARQASGQGTHLDIALFDAVAEWMSVPYLLQQHTGKAPERIGLAHPGICPYGVFVSADDKPFVISIQNEREWQRLCSTGIDGGELLHDERCRDNETRVRHRSYVDEYLQTQFGALLYEEIDAQLSRADLAFAPVNEVADLAQHPDLRTAPITVAGQQVDLPIVPGATTPGVQAVPALGEHTAAVLQNLGSETKK